MLTATLRCKLFLWLCLLRFMLQRLRQRQTRPTVLRKLLCITTTKTLFPYYANVAKQIWIFVVFFSSLLVSGPGLVAILLIGKVVDLLDLVKHLLKVNLEISEETVAETKDPAVDDGIAVLLVGLLNSGCLDDVAALLDNVEFDEAVITLLLIGNGVELFLVQTVDVADVTKPRVEDSKVFGSHGSFDTTAAVVAADNNVLYAEMSDGIVNDAHDIEIGVDNEIGNIAVDKGLAGLQTSNLLGGDTRVTASDPKVVGGLAGAEADKVARILLLLLSSPLAVVFKDAVVGLLEVLFNLLGGSASHDFGFRCRRRVRMMGAVAARACETCGGGDGDAAGENNGLAMRKGSLPCQGRAQRSSEGANGQHQARRRARKATVWEWVGGLYLYAGVLQPVGSNHELVRESRDSVTCD